MKGSNILFKSILFVFGAVLSIFVYSHLSTPAYADNLSCASAVFYQDAQGSVYCITNHDPDTDNAQYNAIGQFDAGDYGYRTAEIDITSSSPGYAGQVTGPNVIASPLNSYNGTRECIDYFDPGHQLCQDVISTVVTDPNNPRLVAPSSSTALACIFENIEITGSNYGIVVCNAAVDHICANDGYLRAGMNNTLGTVAVAFWCDQTSGRGIGGLANPEQVDPSTLKSLPPTVSNVVNPVSYCYKSPDNYNFNDGTQLLVNLNDKTKVTGTVRGGTYTTYQQRLDQIPITSHFVNGNCVMSAITNSTIPRNTINCQIGTYRSSHVDECSCISYYNSNSKTYLANGNTYTALGCISSNFGDVINTFLSIAIGIAGVIALLMMMIGGYEIMTNPAGPDEIKEGQQYIVNAILGLLLIIFTVVVLKIIGVDILGINELAKLLGS